MDGGGERRGFLQRLFGGRFVGCGCDGGGGIVAAEAAEMGEARVGRPVEGGVARVVVLEGQAGYALVVCMLVDFALDGEFDEGQDVGFGQRGVVVDFGLEIGALGDVPDFVDDAEIDAGGGEVLGSAVVGKVVEEAVGGGVGGLAAVADHAGDGGEHDEEVERVLLGEEGVVEVPGAGEFGLYDGVPVGECGVFEEDVLWGGESAVGLFIP